MVSLNFMMNCDSLIMSLAYDTRAILLFRVFLIRVMVSVGNRIIHVWRERLGGWVGGWGV